MHSQPALAGQAMHRKCNTQLRMSPCRRRRTLTKAANDGAPEGLAVRPPQDVIGDRRKPQRLGMAGPLDVPQHQRLSSVVDGQGQGRIPAPKLANSAITSPPTLEINK